MSADNKIVLRYSEQERGKFLAIVAELVETGITLRQAAIEVGVSLSSLKAWREAILKRVNELTQTGMTLTQAAGEVGVSVSLINAWSSAAEAQGSIGSDLERKGLLRKGQRITNRLGAHSVDMSGALLSSGLVDRIFTGLEEIDSDEGRTVCERNYRSDLFPVKDSDVGFTVYSRFSVSANGVTRLVGGRVVLRNRTTLRGRRGQPFELALNETGAPVAITNYFGQNVLLSDIQAGAIEPLLHDSFQRSVPQTKEIRSRKRQRK